MDSEDIPVIRLNEKSLRRLQGKIEKLNCDQISKVATPVEKKEARVPRFEVYRPGVSRLSNRAQVAESSSPSSPKSKESNNSDKDHSSNQELRNDKRNSRGASGKSPKHKNKNEDSQKRRQPNDVSKQDSRNGPDGRRVQPSRGRGRGQTNYKEQRLHSDTNNRGRSRNERKDSWNDSDDPEEEGCLMRQNRRRRREGRPSVTSSNDNSGHEDKDIIADDELIWDDYHGHFLETWGENNTPIATTPEQPTTTSPSVEENFKSDVVEIVNKNDAAPIQNDNEPRQPRGRGRGRRSRVKTNFKTPDGNDDDVHGKGDTEMKRKHLYNPANPDIPIIVKPTKRSKSSGRLPSQEQINVDNEDHQTHMEPPPSYYQEQQRYRSANHYVDPMRYQSYSPQLLANHAPQQRWDSPVHENYNVDEYDNQRNTKESDAAVESTPQHSYEKLLTEAEGLETTISSLLSTSEFTLKMFNEKLQISRTKLKQIYKTLILNYIELSTKRSVEQMLWKNVYHQLMEQLRGRISSSAGDEKNDLKNLLIVILDQATEFYENLLMRLQQTYKINLQEMLTNVVVAKSIHKRAGKRTKLAIMSCHRSLICLGDVARYKENANDSANFGKARHYYIQARSLEPRNGRPYNQLALLAVQTRRKLDAVYYYARSLATTGNPILTARESLIALFDDARRKLDYVKQKEKAASVEQIRPPKSRSNVAKNLQIDQPRTVWILPGTTKEDYISDEISSNHCEDSHLQPAKKTMAPLEMMKHFILIFIHVHGKLFTRVGLDSFDKLKEELLDLFKQILETKPLLLNRQTVLHLFAINFFTVLDQHQKSRNENSTGVLSSHAVQLSFCMISMLTRHATSLLQQLPCNVGQIYDPSFIAELGVLLPSLKVAYDWIYSNRDIWYPTPPIRPQNKIYDLWSSLAGLCDWLIGDYKQFPMRIFAQGHHDQFSFSEVNLPEDFEFSGFAPLANVDREPRFVLASECSDADRLSRVNDCIRLDLIRDFLEYLCGMERPLLAFKQGRYVVLVENAPEVKETKTRLSTNDEPANDVADEEHHESYDHREYDDVKQDDDDFLHLRELRDSLQQTKQDHDKRKDQILASLEATGRGEATVFIKPLNLIPDTNCFIDHLAYIKSLLRMGHYTVFVPLVVLAELEGLSSESKGTDDHAIKVNTNACKAVDFLKAKFTTERSSKLGALTNQGSILNTISFQSQFDIGDKGTNDDLILQCCVKFEEKNISKSPSTRCTVLLSDDRNLRVKSLARNMPTKSLPEFCRWANVEK